MSTHAGYAPPLATAHWGQPENDYVEFRRLLAPDYQDLSGEELEALVHQAFGEDLSPEDIENFMKTLRSAGRGLAQVGRQIAPVAAQLAPTLGTVIGTVAGGPLGAAVGGALGNVAGSALQGVAQPRRPGRPSRRGATPGAVPGQAMAPGRAVQANPAAAGLTGLLSNPAVQQGLMQLLMGSMGRQNVRIAGESVPTAAIANAIEVFAREAAAETNALHGVSGEAVPRYLMDDLGEFIVDPASPEARAALLYELVEADNEAIAAQATAHHAVRQQRLQQYVETLYDQLEERRLMLEALSADDLYDELELDDDEEYDE